MAKHRQIDRLQNSRMDLARHRDAAPLIRLAGQVPSSDFGMLWQPGGAVRLGDVLMGRSAMMRLGIALPLLMLLASCATMSEQDDTARPQTGGGYVPFWDGHQYNWYRP
jgi:hypothetical protein